MTDRTAETDYFSRRLRDTHADELRSLGSIPVGAISAVLAEDPFKLPEEDLKAIERLLEFQFSVHQAAGATVRSDYKPWLAERAPQIRFHYWERLRDFYIGDRVLPPAVVSRLDEVTDEVLDYCGDPLEQGGWARRGMVMGHVQSGKTTNYSALISKAADAGYKIIIILAGLTNSLRRQTQERIDETFIGKKAIFNDFTPELMDLMHYCKADTELGRKLHPAYATTRDLDFDVDVSKFGVSLDNLADPIVFVMKKNKAILGNLHDWLESQSPHGQIDHPLLLIDDEADNASVNTADKRKKVTAINDGIHKVLSKFSRSSYVGYTATPFANIFINPDTEEQMIGDTLFPKHFIKALDPPSNYVGATRMFSPDGDLGDQMVRVVDRDSEGAEVRDYQDILPLKHKRDLKLEELPGSLKEAVRAFLLARTLRCLRGDENAHCSMMINASRFNDVQERINGLVYEYLTELRNAVAANGGLGRRAMGDPYIRDLKATFDCEYGSVEFEFGVVLAKMDKAISSVKVRDVNMRKGELNYDAHKENGLHVIAIGGLALSRGLTLEGLVVSYLLRNASAADTLLQMARWFGYRRNYEDLCRLYTCAAVVDHFEEITDAVEELRGEIKRMEIRGETPEQFGLKVRHSETGIRITAANKMRAAQNMMLAESFENRHVEGFALFNDADINNKNLAAVGAFISCLGAPLDADIVERDDPVRSEAEQHLVWQDCEGRQVMELLRQFRFHGNQTALGFIDGRRSLFMDYAEERLGDELQSWDVAIPLNKGRSTSRFSLDALQNGALPLRSRNHGEVISRDGEEAFKPTGSKNRVADPKQDPPLLLDAAQRRKALVLKKEGDLKGDRAFCHVREKPLLLVHVFMADMEDGFSPLLGKPVVSLSFLMPGTGRPVKQKSYSVNPVFVRQLKTLQSDPDDDEAPMYDEKDEETLEDA